MLLSVNNVKSRKKPSENHKASYFQKCLKEHLYYVKKFAFNLVKLLASKKLLNFNRNVWVLKKKKGGFSAETTGRHLWGWEVRKLPKKIVPG